MLTTSFWKGRRVLVTGHTGFKGSWIFQSSSMGVDVWGASLHPDCEVFIYLFSLTSKAESFPGDFIIILLISVTFNL